MKRKLVDIKALSEQVRAAYAEIAPAVWIDEGMEAKRQRAQRILGERWLLHPTHAPRKGNYDGWPTMVGAK